MAMLPNCFRYAKFHLSRTVDDGISLVRLVPGYQFGPMAGRGVKLLYFLDHGRQVTAGAVGTHYRSLYLL